MKLVVLFLTLIFSFNLQAETADSPSSNTPSNRVPVSTGKYITGGILASTVGFGIGHGIQGRYGEKGWIFTMGEAIGTGLLLGAQCSNKDWDNDGTDEWDCSSRGLLVAGYGMILGFHIWEIVDAWTGATPVDDTAPKAFLIPDPKAPAVGVAWRF